LADFIDEVARAMPSATPDTLFALLNRICDDLVGVRLFTCSLSDLEAGQAARVYTNDPDAYPPTGIEEIVPNRWTGVVLNERRPFLATHIDGAGDVFADHEKIEALGLDSVINRPVYLSETIPGTVNHLHEGGRYSAARLPVLFPAMLPSAVALVAVRDPTPAGTAPAEANASGTHGAPQREVPAAERRVTWEALRMTGQCIRCWSAPSAVSPRMRRTHHCAISLCGSSTVDRGGARCCAISWSS
jgi:hypothetical protein